MSRITKCGDISLILDHRSKVSTVRYWFFYFFWKLYMASVLCKSFIQMSFIFICKLWVFVRNHELSIDFNGSCKMTLLIYNELYFNKKHGDLCIFSFYSIARMLYCMHTQNFIPNLVKIGPLLRKLCASNQVKSWFWPSFVRNWG